MEELKQVDVSGNIAEPIIEKKTTKKTFKDYYNDPAFKEKYLAKVKEPIVCETCQCVIKRYNMQHHRKTAKHIKNEARLQNKYANIEEKGKIAIRAMIANLEKLL